MNKNAVIIKDVLSQNESEFEKCWFLEAWVTYWGFFQLVGKFFILVKEHFCFIFAHARDVRLHNYRAEKSNVTFST